MRLEISHRCYQTPIIEKRIFGFNNIITRVEEQITSDNQTKFFNNGAAVESFNGSVDVKQLSDDQQISDFLSAWLESKGIFDSVFGENSHEQFVMRSDKLVEFLYKKRCLKRERLDRILQWALNVHHFHQGIFREEVEPYLL